MKRLEFSKKLEERDMDIVAKILNPILERVLGGYKTTIFGFWVLILEAVKGAGYSLPLSKTDYLAIAGSVVAILQKRERN